MRLQSIFLGAVALLSSTAVGLVDEEDGFVYDDALLDHYDAMIMARGPCHPDGAHVLAASGAGRNNLHSLGLLQSLVDNITGKIPGSTSMSLPYHKGQATVDSPDPSLAIQQGTHHMRHYIHLFHKRCPHTPIVLAGYSAGSVMMTNNICGGQGVAPLGHRLRNHVAAAIGYGDETYVSGASFDRGSCTAGQGTHPRDDSTCHFNHRLRSYCDAPDPDCCGGDDVNAHFEYPNYDGEASDFAAHRVRHWHKTHHKRHHKHHHKHHHHHHHGHHGDD